MKMLYNSCTGICKFGNNTYLWRIRRRSNLGHIFQENKHVLWAGKYDNFKGNVKVIDEINIYSFSDSKGNPRCITNSKGRKRKPGSKDLATAIRCNDTLFVDFISKCLEWVSNVNKVWTWMLQCDHCNLYVIVHFITS